MDIVVTLNEFDAFVENDIKDVQVTDSGALVIYCVGKIVTIAHGQWVSMELTGIEEPTDDVL